MPFEVSGTRELNATLQKLVEVDVPGAVAAHLFQLAEQIMAESKEIVPVDTGVLRASGHVQLPVITEDRVTVTLGYGGAAAGYAVAVHEIPAYHTPPTQWKYLEVPVRASTDELEDVVTKAVQDAAKRNA